MIETEIKFAITADEAARLLASRAISRLEPESKHVTSTYYDTRQHQFRRMGAALRVRSKGDRFEQTIKVPADGPIGMQNFEEFTVPLPDATPRLELFDDAIIRRISNRRKRLNLLPQFTTDVTRTTAVLTHRKARFEMAVDVGEIRNHGATARSEPITEVEFEMIKGSPVAMLDRVAALAERFDMSLRYATKAQRGYALARPSLRPKPTKAGKVSLPPDLTVGEAFQHIVGEALSQLYANRAPTLAGEPGGIHQSRVSIRRIRAALRAFKRVLPYDKRKAFNGELRWFQQRMGPARDWHVFLDETVPNLRKADVDVDYAALARVAKAERKRATDEAIEVLDSRRYTRLMLQFQRWMLTLEKDGSDEMKGSLHDFALAVFRKTRRDLLVDTRPLFRFSADDLHAVRKKGKKARYATEFFAHLWAGENVKPYLDIMEDLQDRLGEANDATVARHLMATVPLDSLSPETIMEVGKWSDKRIKTCIKSAQPLWRKLQRAKPFWESALTSP